MTTVFRHHSNELTPSNEQRCRLRSLWSVVDPPVEQNVAFELPTRGRFVCGGRPPRLRPNTLSIVIARRRRQGNKRPWSQRLTASVGRWGTASALASHPEPRDFQDRRIQSPRACRSCARPERCAKRSSYRATFPRRS